MVSDQKNVVVAVRCRPLNAREIKRGAACLVSMNGQQTELTKPTVLQQSKPTAKTQRTYTFDYSYWTAGSTSDAGYASQEVIFNDIGRAVLGHALAGYHCCVFAYGQTGSGKSYTMMGGPSGTSEAGLIPRICKELFVQIAQDSSAKGTQSSYNVEVSYLEIYNERVRDLLNPQGSDNLRVREHPSLGPYVEDLTKAAVDSFEAVLQHMSQGNKARTVAATNMNEASSRSHAVFTITVARRTTLSKDSGDQQATERISRISLVDLAGSERADATMATGVRLKEGAKINQSLAALGKVISALADREKVDKKKMTTTTTMTTTAATSAGTALASASAGGTKREAFVPYRDSVLTWLLKDSLGGNSRTFMIATVSPADYAETLSTLRYADRAKHIVNQATVNEDAHVRLVRDLKAEIQQLQKRLAQEETSRDLEDRLLANQKLVAELNTSWEEKLRRTQEIQAERERALAALGIQVDTNRAGRGVGLHAPKDIPHLVNLSEDPLMSECLVYNLKPGRTLVGSSEDADIRLGGSVSPEHCTFEYNDSEGDGTIWVHPRPDCLVMVNGLAIDQPKELRSGYRIIIGLSFVFRLNHPQQARQDRQRMAESTAAGEYDGSADWQYAWDEAHPDSMTMYRDYGSSSNNNNNNINESPSIWSDSQSETSDMYDAASVMTSTTTTIATTPATFSALASSHHYAHLHNDSDPAMYRPSSQAAVRRTTSIGSSSAQRQRRYSTATDIAMFRNISPAFESRSRPRGQTVSGLNILGARASRRPGPQTATLPPGSSSSTNDNVLVDIRGRQRLARLVLAQWRRHKLVKVGETMLRNAVHLKEANIIGKELGQRVVYQFAILRGGAEAYPESPLEPEALPTLLADWDSISISGDAATHKGGIEGPSAWQSRSLGHPLLDSTESTVPEVVVKVLDIGHRCWYVWSLATFHAQLAKMRSLSTVKGSYRAHLVLDPFHATPAPRYSCIGSATYPLWPGNRPYSVKIDAPVIDALSGLERGRALGSLAVLPINRSRGPLGSVPSGAAQGGNGLSRVWNVIVHIKSLSGVSETEMTSVHCRLRLARVRGLLPSTPPTLTTEEPLQPTLTIPNGSGLRTTPDSPVLVSTTAEQAARHNSPLSGFGDGPVNIQFRQQWTVDYLTSDTCVVAEFFGAAQPLALRNAFHEDVQIESALQAGKHLDTPAALAATASTTEPSNNNNNLSASQNLLVERLHEEELFVDSQHELLVWIRVHELGLDGQWERAPCGPSGQPKTPFLLRQGVQRRVEIIIGHNINRHLQITGVSGLRIGCPTLVDEKGRLISSGNSSPVAVGDDSIRTMAPLIITKVQLASGFGAGQRFDNRCFVQIGASWDTSVLGSRLLDIPTDRNMRVKMLLELSLDIANGAGPLVVATDIYVQIHSRQASLAGRSWLASLAESASGFFRQSSSALASSSSTNTARTSGRSSNISLNASANDALTSSEALPPLSDPVFRVFSVTLSPANTACGKENLWRLNTAKKYVRGEETLLPWHPRSVRLVDEHHRLEHEEAWRLLVARTRQQIEALGPLHNGSPSNVTNVGGSDSSSGGFAEPSADLQAVRCALEHSSPSEPQTPLTFRQQRILTIVYEAVRRITEFRRVPDSGLGLQQEPIQHTAMRENTNDDEHDNSQESNKGAAILDKELLKPGSNCRLPCNVHEILMQGHFCLRGWINVLDTNAAPDTWCQKWFVIERPYIFVYVDQACRFLDNVINIASARIDVDPHVSEMLGRENVMALYTNTNAFLLNPPGEEMQKWISAIDEWYYLLL
ncbi:hypothetical protein GGI07_002167 [Coemansia sp. Benny D115]|nr:hypothetical protein GGI07_002167 [Coemansia sp. Benny D115]